VQSKHSPMAKKIKTKYLEDTHLTEGVTVLISRKAPLSGDQIFCWSYGGTINFVTPSRTSVRRFVPLSQLRTSSAFSNTWYEQLASKGCSISVLDNSVSWATTVWWLWELQRWKWHQHRSVYDTSGAAGSEVLSWNKQAIWTLLPTTSRLALGPTHPAIK